MSAMLSVIIHRTNDNNNRSVNKLFHLITLCLITSYRQQHFGSRSPSQIGMLALNNV